MLLDAGLTPGGAPLFLCWCTWSSPGCLPHYYYYIYYYYYSPLLKASYVPLAQQVRSGRALQGNPSLPILFLPDSLSLYRFLAPMIVNNLDNLFVVHGWVMLDAPHLTRLCSEALPALPALPGDADIAFRELRKELENKRRYFDSMAPLGQSQRSQSGQGSVHARCTMLHDSLQSSILQGRQEPLQKSSAP